MEWIDQYSSTCPGCRAMYAERNPPGTPPCDTCQEILIEENEDIAKVYMMTRRQVITAEEGRILDVSIPAIKTVMDLLGIRNQKECLMQVMKTFHHFQGKKE